jgi:hypothetical protein
VAELDSRQRGSSHICEAGWPRKTAGSLTERDLISPAMVKARRAAGLVRGHLLGGFKLVAVFNATALSGRRELAEAPDSNNRDLLPSP